MTDQKYISKLINYYLTDNMFVDLIHNTLGYDYFEFRRKLKNNYSDLEMLLFRELLSFREGIGDYSVDDSDTNSRPFIAEYFNFYLAGIKAGKLRSAILSH